LRLTVTPHSLFVCQLLWDGNKGGKTFFDKKKELAESLNPFFLLLAGSTRLELATSGVTAAPKFTPPCDFN
jgi:hypothetical protein